MLNCSNCGTPYNVNDAVCVKCGHPLFDPKSSTVVLQVDPSFLRLRRTRTQTGILHPEKSVSLLIRGMAERFIFEEGTEIILGRTDLLTASAGHFDLTRYGGHDRGVSRTHAVLRFAEDSISITDMNSSNGTFINSKRLAPNASQILHHGDELMLGSLSMVIKFE